jgi:endonuclease/exonuclease/phosphatase family metal-dependent hydrolase
MDICVATYNIASLAKSLTGKNTVKNGFAKARAVLLSSRADVICLQEVGGKRDGSNQAQLLADALGMNCLFQQSDNTTKIIYGIAILSRFPVISGHTIPLPKGSAKKDSGDRQSGAKELRTALAVKISPTSGAEFRCICTHFGIYNSADTNAGASLGPVQAIEKLLASAVNPTMPAILAGGLNAQPTTPTVRYFHVGVSQL